MSPSRQRAMLGRRQPDSLDTAKLYHDRLSEKPFDHIMPTPKSGGDHLVHFAKLPVVSTASVTDYRGRCPAWRER